MSLIHAYSLIDVVLTFYKNTSSHHLHSNWNKNIHSLFFEDHCNTDLYSILNLDYKQHGRTKVNIKALVPFRSVLNDSTSTMYQHTNLITKILWIWIAKWNCLRDCLCHIYSGFLTEQIHKFMISSWIVSLIFDWRC